MKNATIKDLMPFKTDGEFMMENVPGYIFKISDEGKILVKEEDGSFVQSILPLNEFLSCKKFKKVNVLNEEERNLILGWIAPYKETAIENVVKYSASGRVRLTIELELSNVVNGPELPNDTSLFKNMDELESYDAHTLGLI